jgi:hypothetical protein
MINEPQISPQHGKWEIQSESSFTIVAQKKKDDQEQTEQRRKPRLNDVWLKNNTHQSRD